MLSNTEILMIAIIEIKLPTLIFSIIKNYVKLNYTQKTKDKLRSNEAKITLN